MNNNYSLYLIKSTLCFVVFILIFQNFAFSQKGKNGVDNFSQQNFKAAIDDLKPLLKKDSLNAENNYKLGICYLNTNIDKSLAIKYLEVASKQTKIDGTIWFDLGRAYLLNYKFEDAINAFKKFKSTPEVKDDPYMPSTRMIEMCENAVELMKKPINVSFKNLGIEINSAFPDFGAYVPTDESFIVYSSKRPGNSGGLQDFDGFTTSDILYSTQKNDKWLKGKSLGININSPLVEETAGLSADGNNIFVFVDNAEGLNDIFISNRKGKTFQKSVSLGPMINGSEVESSAALFPDGKTLIFSSDRAENNYGGKDLYISNKLPSGEWGKPVNLGDVINTKYDEDFPYLASDGKTLYFASQGHNSMGGFDYFKSVWDEKANSWSDAMNLGYPLNTTDDEKTISFSASGRYAYISALRKEGFGDMDIYRVTFNDIAPLYTVIKGVLLNKDSSNVFEIKPVAIDSVAIKDSINLAKEQKNKSTNKKNVPKKVEVKVEKPVVESKPVIQLSIINKITQKIVGVYTPNNITGKFTIILLPGEYSLVCESNKYQKYTEDITIREEGVGNNEMSKTIFLNQNAEIKK
ncbi:MAG: PD40 domain-containing protein [Bacteroidetes bacterium]|nr:PD40 domain-containing protein [Bacteroidota bacterium]